MSALRVANYRDTLFGSQLRKLRTTKAAHYELLPRPKNQTLNKVPGSLLSNKDGSGTYTLSRYEKQTMQALLEKLENYQHIIWDWNGTLIDDAAQVLHIVNEMLTEQGLNTITLDEYRDRFTHPVIDFYKGLGFNFETFPFDELCVEFGKKYAALLPTLTLHEDAQEVANAIAQGQWTQSILSAAPEQSLIEGVEKFGLKNYFNHIYGLDNAYAASKIQRGHELIKAADIPTAKTVLIGDTDHDLEVAQELGIDLILIAKGHQSFERLHKLHPNTLHGLKAAA